MPWAAASVFCVRQLNTAMYHSKKILWLPVLKSRLHVRGGKLAVSGKPCNTPVIFSKFIFKLHLITVFWKKTQMSFFPASKCYVLLILEIQLTRTESIKTEIKLNCLLPFWSIYLISLRYGFECSWNTHFLKTTALLPAITWSAFWLKQRSGNGGLLPKYPCFI